MALINAFRRATAMMTLVAAAMAAPFGQRQAQLAAIGPYKSRGKGGKRPRHMTGISAMKRAAKKARNVARNRRAHRN